MMAKWLAMASIIGPIKRWNEILMGRKSDYSIACIQARTHEIKQASRQPGKQVNILRRTGIQNAGSDSNMNVYMIIL